ncbi:Ribonuclease/ribotoxin, partial [Armillaria mellea]
PPSTVTCGTNTYSRTDIQAAIKDGHAHINKQMGKRKYPHTYENIEELNMGSCAKPYYEFPILKTHNIYNGGEPDTDRVVFDSDGNYCAVMTHTGAPRDKFVLCVDSVSSTTTPSSIR